MAVKLDEVRHQIVLSLYDLILSSDEESYWYSLSIVREYIDPDISGALAKIAIDSLVSGGSVERGRGDDINDIYSLTEKGITAAEGLVSEGKTLEDYAVSPSVDLILERDRDGDQIAEIRKMLEDIQSQLSSSNATVLIPSVDKEIIAGELRSAGVIAEADSFRLKPFSAFILPALRFLSDKFVGTALGEAAKQLIKLLLGQ